MSAWTPKRRSRGEWITAFMAEHADVRTLADALAFLACGACLIGLGLAAHVIGGFFTGVFA